MLSGRDVWAYNIRERGVIARHFTLRIETAGRAELGPIESFAAFWGACNQNRSGQVSVPMSGSGEKVVRMEEKACKTGH